MKRTNVSSGAPWEAAVGYSRAVRVGPFVYVAGTTATDEAGNLTAPGDAYAQAVQALSNVEAALKCVGAQTADVVLTRVYVGDAAQWQPVGRAHREFFGDVSPAATLVEAGFVYPAILAEIEVDAVVSEAATRAQEGEIDHRRSAK